MKLFLSILIMLFLAIYITPYNLFKEDKISNYDKCQKDTPYDLDSGEREIVVYLCQEKYKGN